MVLVCVCSDAQTFLVFVASAYEISSGVAPPLVRSSDIHSTQLIQLMACDHAQTTIVQPMGFVTNYCLHPGLQALLAFLSGREALTPIGAVEVLGDFDLAAGPHV